MKALVRFGACAILIAACAPAIAATDPEEARLACDLVGACGPAAVVPPVPEKGAPRSGATRGFTFKRQAPAPAAMPTPTPADRTAARPVAPSRPGAANLRLNFASGSAVLTDADKARLDRLAHVLDMPALAGRRTRIEGHTDASGSAAGNRELSRRRAQAAADYLASTGIPADRLQVVGFGSTQPLPGTPATSPENRRVMAVVLP